MGTTLTPDNLPAGRDRNVGRGHGTEALGPSDSSDSGSDVVGEDNLDSDTDRFGTGEAAAAGDDAPDDAQDIGTDRIVEPSELEDNAEDADRSSRKRP